MKDIKKKKIIQLVLIIFIALILVALVLFYLKNHSSKISESDCLDLCLKKGFDHGQCDLLQKIDASKTYMEDIKSVGDCLGTSEFCSKNNCECICANNDPNYFNVNFRISKDLDQEFNENDWISLDINRDGLLEGYCYTGEETALPLMGSYYSLGISFTTDSFVYILKNTNLPFILLGNITKKFYSNCSIAEISIKPISQYKNKGLETYIVKK
ncbi:MAG: hypothetical protein WC402_02570 [Candidatus Pacearchaeota archaeon]|jgi:hypothetical protein